MKISMSPEEFQELIISHHPNHPCFNDDVVTLFGHRVCAGCLFAYPTALFVLVFFRPTGFEAIISAICLAIISQARQVIDYREINFFFRFIAGVALGFGAGGLIWAVRTQDLLAAVLILISGIAYASIRYLTMKRRIEVWQKKG